MPERGEPTKGSRDSGTPSISGVRRLLALAYPERVRLILATVFLLMGSGLSLSYPWVIGRLVDLISTGQAEGVLDQAVLGLLGVFAGLGLVTALRSYLFDTAGERIVARLRQALYASIVRQEIAFFDAQRTGELTNRLAADTTVLQNAVTLNVSMGLRFGATLLGALVIMGLTSWRLTLVMLAVVPLVAVGATVYARRLRRVSREVQDALAESTAHAEESLSGIRTVRAFAREEAESVRYAGAVERSYDLARLRARLRAVFQGLMTFLGYGAIAAVLWYGGRLVTQGLMSFGELTAFILYTFTVAFSMGVLTSLWGDLAKALGASERVFELMGRAPATRGGSERLEVIEGRVRFEGVRFNYPSREDTTVLAGLDLELHPGEVVALVGPSGAGKSTVAALLSRFYDPDQGELSLDGRPYTALDPDWLRERVVGVVSQEPILFATTIEENIRYGRAEATAEEVQAAARAANAHEFVSAFPDGYQTLVGERGVRLSGGQKQRVAIARAVLKDPRLLVLDEATSALDAESEHLVQEALDRLQEGRTTLVIAHRLSTVRDADRVVVLDQGRVAEEGAHQELMDREGLYRRLVERQFAAA
jgi:ABC transporter fused permease/ATP-binding protein